MSYKYIVTVQELYEKRYLVSNAVAPQQAQEWIENMEYGLSEMIENNIRDLDEEHPRFITEGRNNIVDSLKDIKVETVDIHGDVYKVVEGKNTEWVKDAHPDLPLLKKDMGCTCGYDEEEIIEEEEETNQNKEEDVSTIQEAYKGFIKKHAPNWNNEEVCGKDEDGNRAEMKLGCPDDKCDCNS